MPGRNQGSRLREVQERAKEVRDIEKETCLEKKRKKEQEREDEVKEEVKVKNKPEEK